MENRKEFVIRMYLLAKEIPKEKIEDYENILSLLSFQLKLREIELIEDAAETLSSLVNRSSIHNSTKKYMIDEIDVFTRQDRFTLQIPEDNKEETQQVLGVKGDKQIT